MSQGLSLASLHWSESPRVSGNTARRWPKSVEAKVKIRKQPFFKPKTSS